MKIPIPVRNDYITDQYSRNIDHKTGITTRTRFPDVEKPEEASKIQREKSPSTVLSSQEKTTLYMLFGSEKPEDLNFYNNNKVSLINRGRLIDLKG
ncbi:MAG: hypothetical protein GXO91_05015 [FCB group bacterium]|nr:hypothetical protein [FCB group bacterium]